MATANIESRIGSAWHLCREGNSADAVKKFKAITDETTDNADAFYGLGLAQRLEGESDAAIESFQKAMALSKEAHDTVFSQTEGQAAVVMETSEDARHMMLQRMITQRLVELGVEAD